MRLTVSSIPEEGLHEQFVLPITVGDNTIPDNAHVSLRITRLGSRVIIDGSVNVSLSLKCSRCLRDFSCPQNIAFSNEYEPSGSVSEEGEQELGRSQLDVSHYTDDEIDIGAVIQEQVLLTVPMKPLCDEGCMGLCPGCGQNLNEELCNCKKNEVDPRLAPLGRLKELMKERKE